MAGPLHGPTHPRPQLGWFTADPSGLLVPRGRHQADGAEILEGGTERRGVEAFSAQLAPLYGLCHAVSMGFKPESIRDLYGFISFKPIG